MTIVVSEPVAAWPLTSAQHELIARLSSMIRRFGPERFTTAHLVRADHRDFPSPWKPTLTAVHEVLYRLCWHAHIDPEIVVEDRRPATPHSEQLLKGSEIELASTSLGVATFHVGAIGNDDVAGLLSHKILIAVGALAGRSLQRPHFTEIEEQARRDRGESS